MIPCYLYALALSALTCFVAQARRIVAVGDLHGDLANSRKTFRMAGLIDDDDRWIGNDTVFVQTGDVLDRGTDTIALYDLLRKLRDEAPATGGEVIPLLGNHEVMNLIGDWRYVTRQEIDTFGSYEDRVKAFRLDGFLGEYLGELNMTAVVDGNVFCHGGIDINFAKLGVDTINSFVHEDMPVVVGQHKDPHGVFGEQGPTWYRGWALDKEPGVCEAVQQTLSILKADRMIIGHTPQLDGQILTRCDGKIIVIDIGLSWVYGGHAGALEIDGEKLTAIYKSGRVDLTPSRPPPFVHQELR
ncbi:Metallo-dependent phosphatase [Hesseltinella vesiculosa]|uniref:Metallo-dependent phosphatase n=1 Tax=Hesseltinella vesiculosa TaxID=101127 RepID=A0A1X2GAP8_9FUNG|nr:Metallo-dependent phosphatase [Hesseltinella vesiculosa]